MHQGTNQSEISVKLLETVYFCWQISIFIIDDYFCFLRIRIPALPVNASILAIFHFEVLLLTVFCIFVYKALPWIIPKIILTVSWNGDTVLNLIVITVYICHPHLHFTFQHWNDFCFNNQAKTRLPMKF